MIDGPGERKNFGRLRTAKSALAVLLYLASLGMLVNCAIWLDQVLQVFTPTYPRSFGRHVPAFTEAVLTQMPNTPSICLVSGLLSLVLVIVAVRKAASHDAKVFWVSMLAAINLFVCAHLAPMTIIGFFLLPKIANAA